MIRYYCTAVALILGTVALVQLVLVLMALLLMASGLVQEPGRVT